MPFDLEIPGKRRLTSLHFCSFRISIIRGVRHFVSRSRLMRISDPNQIGFSQTVYEIASDGGKERRGDADAPRQIFSLQLGWGDSEKTNRRGPSAVFQPLAEVVRQVPQPFKQMAPGARMASAAVSAAGSLMLRRVLNRVACGTIGQVAWSREHENQGAILRPHR